jgi:MoxR-like ATPase
MKLKVGYPREDEELEILQLADREARQEAVLEQVAGVETLNRLKRSCLDLYVDPRVDRYVISLVQATRHAEAFGLKGMVQWGASPRASLALKACARALAFVRGRSFATPDEVKELAPDVLRHRILTTFEAEARGIDTDEVIRQLLKNITVP